MKRLLGGFWVRLVIFGFFVIFNLLYLPKANADVPADSGCPSIDTSLNVLTKIPTAKYNLYAKIDQATNYNQVSIYSQSAYGYCTELRKSTILSQNWTLISSGFDVKDEETGFLASINGTNVDSESSDHQIELLMLPTSIDIKFDGNNLTTKISSETAQIIPKQSPRPDGNLRINYIQALDPNFVENVSYYVDNKLAYTRRADLNDVTYKYLSQYSDSSQLRREVYFKTGDKVTITTPLDIENITFYAYLKWLFMQIPPIIFVLIILLIVLLATMWVLKLVSFFYKRRTWLINHGLLKPKQIISVSQAMFLQKIYSSFYVLRRILLGLGIAIFVLVFVLSFVVDVFHVDGPSMQNTLKTGNKLLVYKSKVRTTKLLTNKPYSPNRGAIVVLDRSDSDKNWLARTMAFQQKGTIVKRVIGLPGENVEIVGNQVTITKLDGTKINPDINGKWSNKMIEDYRGINLNVKLQSDEVFVLGDNRPESIDSRYLGAIKLSKIIGEVKNH